MAWLQLTVETDRAHCEALAGFFEQFAAASVSMSAASDEPLFDHSDGQESGHWQRTRVSALLPADIDLDILLVCMRDRIGAEHIFSREIARVDDQDWVADFQQQQKPLIFADRLCVRPGWCDAPEGDYAIVELDPGLAFGTGTHPTTALCLEWLATHDLNGRSVIDYGCGSGILAIAAATLGAAQVYAVDIDEQALAACRENARNNRLESQIKITDATGPVPAAVDVLMANVLLNPLLDLAKRFASLVKPGGSLVLSGLLPDQVETCLAAYRPCFNMQAPVFRDE
ncbi:MAG: 50S ribosomal protein L11 methyltransferase, partial [Gammaproteobacteria bacterium]|nr:50S ribosomal protein L11 methyltransferase [Gammaproteobacteria bacterium]